MNVHLGLQRTESIVTVVCVLLSHSGDDRTDYWEVHVTPNDFLMDIHIPERGGGAPWSELVAPCTGI